MCSQCVVRAQIAASGTRNTGELGTRSNKWYGIDSQGNTHWVWTRDPSAYTCTEVTGSCHAMGKRAFDLHRPPSSMKWEGHFFPSVTVHLGFRKRWLSRLLAIGINFRHSQRPVWTNFAAYASFLAYAPRASQ